MDCSINGTIEPLESPAVALNAIPVATPSRKAGLVRRSYRYLFIFVIKQVLLPDNRSLSTVIRSHPLSLN